jgi:cytochrome c biogenesis protein|uniref:C-type cytochrome biogenensis protein n=1 Tax=Cyanidiaceae sp. MX-AZ01 TaxID=1503164 RepID=A0A060AEB6_9RHOD|nr:c-type cytochrome biogenensis protein [Cyanidiaceae sp. MX-AZ01]
MKWLIKLEVAIALLLMIAFVSVIGTLIPQDQSAQFYQTQYSLGNFILLCQLDHVYHSVLYMSLLVLLSISLLGCTLKVQIPSWKFLRIKTKWHSIPAQVQQANKWHEFEKNQIAPMAIHISMITMMIASMWDALGGFVTQELIPVSEMSHIQNVISAGPLSRISQQLNLRVNKFEIYYDQKGFVKQFTSDVEILDNNGVSQWHDRISVNHPGKYQQLWIYQTDWKWQAVRLKVNDDMYECAIVQNGNGGFCKWDQKLIWFPQYTNTTGVIYENGHMLGKIQNQEAMVAAGLQIKASPGLNLIWTASISLLTSLIWLLL